MNRLIESTSSWPPTVLALGVIVVHVMIQLGIAGRVIMRRRPVGESLSWIMLVLMLPVVGPAIYLMLGELRLGARRARRVQQLIPSIRQRMYELDRPSLEVWWDDYGDDGQQLARAGLRTLFVPALPGNELQLLNDWQAVFDRLIADIDRAQHSCDLEFYIWHSGGRTDDVLEALIRACGRGVRCRVLLDALGSRPFFRSASVRRLRAAGAQVQAALPGSLLRLPFVRFDLRLHRKIAIIDEKIAYAGSQNLVDPRYFKKHARVGQWVDAMVRLQGPSVEPLMITFLCDWHVETSDSIKDLAGLAIPTQQVKHGSSPVQVLPSGPANEIDAIEQLLITAIYFARKEVVMTTPYFVPSEALQMALRAAASRGVKVIVILPAKVDSRLVRLASRAFKGDLLNAGVLIAQFHGGLLHTKSVTIDRKTSLFGSMNLDPRSFRLNFEITLAVYDAEFTHRLRSLQQAYLDNSELLDLEEWHNRPVRERVVENIARLFGPLL